MHFTATKTFHTLVRKGFYMTTRHVHVAACFLVACLSFTCGAIGEELKSNPTIQGTWVLKALGHSDSPESIIPVKDDNLMRFIFDDSTLKILIRNQAPKSVRYRLKKDPGQEYIYFLQFTTRPDVGWRTIQCQLDSRLYIVFSDADELLPMPIGSADRNRSVVFIFERSR